MKGFATLELDLPSALRTHLLDLLEKMESAPLAPEFIEPVPRTKQAQGVYLLLYRGRVVYVGKTDGRSGLRGRLVRHWRRVQHRVDINAGDVTFKAVRVYVFTAMNLETQLRAHFQPEWDKSGFGSNDPGTERETTKLKPGGFDASFPIDIDRPIEVDFSNVETVAGCLERIRKELPYTFRWEENTDLSLPLKPPSTKGSARSFITLAVKALPPGWQATALAGRIILYKAVEDFQYGTVIARS